MVIPKVIHYVIIYAFLIWVTAIKTASRGEGIIVCLYVPSLPESDVIITANHFTISKAFLCDAREHDLGPLEVRDGVIRVAMPGTAATIRLVPGPKKVTD